MARLTAGDLQPVKEYREALPRSDGDVSTGLEKLINEEGGCLMPILFHMDPLGSPCIVDGYTRYDIWTSNKDDLESPACREVVSLSGAEPEEVVEWIRKHQAYRRNDEKLIREYVIGKQSQKKGTGPTSEEFGITRSQAYHAEKLADAVDKLDEIEPGLKDKAIASGVPPKVIKDVAESGDSAPIHEAVSHGSPKRRKPKGPLAHFKKVNTLSGQLNRALMELIKATDHNSWSDRMTELMKEFGNQLQEWEDSEIMGQ